MNPSYKKHFLVFHSFQWIRRITDYIYWVYYVSFHVFSSIAPSKSIPGNLAWIAFCASHVYEGGFKCEEKINWAMIVRMGTVMLYLFSYSTYVADVFTWDYNVWVVVNLHFIQTRFRFVLLNFKYAINIPVNFSKTTTLESLGS